MKTKQDNEETNHIDLVYIKIETKLLGPIWLGALCDENQTGQRCVMKNRKDNDMIDHTCVVHAENDTQLSWLIGSCVVCDENQIGQWCDWLYKSGLRWKWYWIVETYQNGSSL